MDVAQLAYQQDWVDKRVLYNRMSDHINSMLIHTYRVVSQGVVVALVGVVVVVIGLAMVGGDAVELATEEDAVDAEVDIVGVYSFAGG